MTRNHFLAALRRVVLVGSTFGCFALTHASSSSTSTNPDAAPPQILSGFKVRLVVVADAAWRREIRMADHAWLPNGKPYLGPQRRLDSQASRGNDGGRTPRWLVFELELPGVRTRTHVRPELERDIDVIAYLPNGGSVKDDFSPDPAMVGPVRIELPFFIREEVNGYLIRSWPFSVNLKVGVQNTMTQPVLFGIARGKYKVVAKGTVKPFMDLKEGQSAVIASGSWGRIEAGHIAKTTFEGSGNPTHVFKLLGSPIPPSADRKVLFYDSKGVSLGGCGDGPNNPGYLGHSLYWPSSPAKVASFEIQERPYEFVKFENVTLKAPEVEAYRVSEGVEHAAVSPIGKLLGVLEPGKEGPWRSVILYAADGKRWLDPGCELDGFEYGEYDPSNFVRDEVWDVLFQPSKEFLGNNGPITYDVFAADSPTGPPKERLTFDHEPQVMTPLTRIYSKATSRPYIRFEVQSGQGIWKTLESIPVTRQMLAVSEKGEVGSRVLDLYLDEDGSVRIHREGLQLFVSQPKWRPGKQRVRAIANLKDGTIADLNFNSSGYTGEQPRGHRYRGFEYSKQTAGTLVLSGSKWLDIKDIVSFELQAQDLNKPVWLSVHTPVH